jgi:hypothetical protein
MAAPLIEPSSQLTEQADGTKKTTELRTGDRVTTPDGDRVGLVRCTYPGGLTGKNADRTAVRFFVGSVRHTDPTNTTRVSSFVDDVPNDADWQKWRFAD